MAYSAVGLEVARPFDHLRFDDAVIGGELFEHIEAIHHVAEGGVAAINQVQARRGELGLKQE